MTQNTDTARRRKLGSLASAVGIIANLILFGGKAAVGLLSGAISITADAFNNLSDAGSQIISLVSFRLSAKPADRDHPFGHARIEYVASMIVSFLVLHVGFDLVVDSVNKLINPEPPSREGYILTLCVLGAAVAVKLGLGLFNLAIARRIDAAVLRATAADCFSDAMATTAILIGTVVYLITDWVWVDAAMGLAVSLLIIWAGIKIFNETKNSILGEGPSDDIIRDIRVLVEQYPEALGIHDLVVHNYGPGRTIASLHIEVDGKGDLFALHDTIDNIEKQLTTQLGIQATIHMDPIVTDNIQVSALRALTLDAVTAVDSRLHIHDFRCVVGQTHTNLIFDIAAPFELDMSDTELKAAVSLKLATIDPTLNAVMVIDRE